MYSRGYRGSGLALAHRLGWHVGRGLSGLFSRLHESFSSGYQSSAATPPNRRANAKGKYVLALLLIVVPLLIVAAVGPAEWFLNWPAMFGLALLLTALLRGPLSTIHYVGKKILRLTISTCLLYAFWRLLNWKPLWDVLNPFGLTRNGSGFRLILLAIIAWWISVFWILFSRTRHQTVVASGPSGVLSPQSQYSASNPPSGSQQQQTVPLKAPKLCFSDIGGLEDEKRQICELVKSRLEPGMYSKYGVVRNGILLYGPPGSGKTFLAEATAGEFDLPFRRILASDLISMWMGDTERRIQAEFEYAGAHAPILLFFDEVDSLVTARQPLSGTGGDPTGSGRSLNSATTKFMEMMAQYREVPGLVLMLATNRMEGLDEAAIREGRIDLEIRVDLPNEPTRLKILQKQLEKRPWRRFDLKQFARKTVGTSPARIRALVDKAAMLAVSEGRRIQERDLDQAFEEIGGKDRGLLEKVEWSDVVLGEDVETEIRTLVRLLNEPNLAERMHVPIPSGLLLVGATGTGKTTIARLIASEANRSFYAVTPADLLGRYTGDSVKQVAALFSRAKGHSPSVIFIDEIDALLPQANASLGQYDVQVVDQFLMETSSLQAENRVFLIGATNRPESVDPRVLRGGRLSEKIKIGVPGSAVRSKLLCKFLGPVQLEPELDEEVMLRLTEGLAPADLKAVCEAAKRAAFMRAQKNQSIPPLGRPDIEAAIVRVRG